MLNFIDYREMLIKTMTRYLKPIKIAVIKKKIEEQLPVRI